MPVSLLGKCRRWEVGGSLVCPASVRNGFTDPPADPTGSIKEEMTVMKWIFAATLAAVLTAGCAANIGVFEAHHQTQVELSGPNYQVIVPNLRGKAEAYYFLGLFRTSGTGLV